MNTVANFSIEYLQYLSPESEVLQELPEVAKNTETLLQLYKIMNLTRTFDTKAIALQRTGKLGTYASSLGQEAIGAAVGILLAKDDIYCPHYRDYATLLQRGVKMSEILAFWGGDERGNNYANGSKDFPFCIPIASQCLHAAGAATAIKYRREKQVCVVSLGDGGTSEGDFYEALNLAGVWHLPLVCVVSNNQWAISVPRNKQTFAKTIAQKGIAAGVPAVQVDGNDIFAIYQAVETAITKARQGKGPYLIEALTYRLSDHTTADDASRYREQEDVQRAWSQEPIRRLRQYLANLGLWNPEKEETLKQQCKDDVEAAVQEYLNAPNPEALDMFGSLYATLPEALLEQVEELTREGQQL